MTVVDGLVAAAEPSCSAPAQLLYQKPASCRRRSSRHPPARLTPRRLVVPSACCDPTPSICCFLSLTPVFSSELLRSAVHPESVFVFVLVSAGDRNSVGSTGSVGSTRSAGSGQSTESTSAPNGLQHHSGHHDNANKVHSDPESPDSTEMFLKELTFRVCLSVNVVVHVHISDVDNLSAALLFFS